MDRVIAASVLVETVARGSISAAANHLGMSRAMASRYISVIEEWAGVRLLHRTTRRLSLTPAGEEVLLSCKQLLALSEEITTQGNKADAIPRGLLRITASSIFSEYCLTDLLTEFLAQYPAVSVDLQVIDRLTNLAEEGIDLAIRVTKAPDPGVIARKLATVRAVICASPAYLAARGKPVSVYDLSAHNCLTYNYLGKSAWQFMNKSGTFQVPVAGNFSTNEASIVARAALSGSGIAMLPLFAAKQFITEGRLVALFSDIEVEPLYAFAVYLSRKRIPYALRVMLNFLAERLAVLDEI